MSKGRHRAPVEHHVGRTLATSTVAAAVSTGLFTLPQPAQAATVVPQSATRVATSLLPAPATLPGTPGTSSYTVSSGETLGGIGQKVGESWQQLYGDNTAVIGSNPDLIFPGQRLTVGAGTMTPPSAASSVAEPVGAHTAVGQDVVDTARQYLGVAYVWGGASPSGFDCSGLVQYVYAKYGISLPHSSLAQSGIGQRVASLADAQPGDLVFFYSPVGHVGIYVGNGMMIAAPQAGETVKEQSVWETPTVIRRVL